MFLKLNGYFLPPDKLASLELYNGTWEASENVITRDRMLDVSIVGNGKRTAIDTNQWSELGLATVLTFKTGAPGTYVLGVSTGARTIEMDAEAFNGYLEHDGIVDVLAARKADPTKNTDTNERYSKHVKTMFQVGEKRTDDWSTPLGYPIEFVPLVNPYELKAGGRLPFKLLLRGEPLANQLVYFGGGAPAPGHAHAGNDHEHSHDGGAGHSHGGLQQIRTNENGEALADLPGEGVWYLRTIHLMELDDPTLTHESNWATLTFEVGHGHAHGSHADARDHNHDHDHDHDHDQGTNADHDHEGGLPSYAFWLGSLAIIGGLFFFFNRKQ